MLNDEFNSVSNIGTKDNYLVGRLRDLLKNLGYIFESAYSRLINGGVIGAIS